MTRVQIKPVQGLRTTLFWDITQGVVVIPYRCFGTTYWSHLQQSRTTVRNYHYSLRNNAEEHSSHLLRGGTLKSRSGVVLGSISEVFKNSPT